MLKNGCLTHLVSAAVVAGPAAALALDVLLHEADAARRAADRRRRPVRRDVPQTELDLCKCGQKKIISNLKQMRAILVGSPLITR